MSLFTLPLPIRVIFTDRVEGNISPYLADFLGYIPISVVLSACSLIVFYFSYYSLLPARLARFLPAIQTPSTFGAITASAVIIAISLTLLSILAATVGGLSQFILLGYGSSRVTTGAGYLAAGLPWLFVATMFIFVAFSISRSRTLFVIGSFALVANVGLHIVMGNRSMVLYILICFGTFFLLKVKYVRWRALFLIGLIVIGMTRKSGYQNFDDFISKSVEGGSAALSESSHSVFYTLTIGEFVVPFETLPQMVRTVGTEIEPWLGWSYVRAPVFLVPSAIYPNRPVDLSNWYMEQFYGQEGHLNEGRQFFFLAEAYLNFGPLGIILISAIWGLCWRAWLEWLKRCKFDPGATMIYALGLGFMFRCISGTWVSFLSGFTQQSLAIAIAGLIIAGARVIFVSSTRSTHAAAPT